jgi:hypothetical protein
VVTGRPCGIAASVKILISILPERRDESNSKFQRIVLPLLSMSYPNEILIYTVVGVSRASAKSTSARHFFFDAVLNPFRDARPN